MINLTLNGKKIKTRRGSTVLQAALENGIYIPNLCYHPDLPPIGACRLCIVKIKGMKGVPASCTVKAREGMEVLSETDDIREKRKDLMWLTLSEHSPDMNKSSQLYKVARHVGVKNFLEGYEPETENIPEKTEDPLFIRDMNRCILCGRCVRMCRDVRKAGVLGLAGRGIKTTVSTSYDLPLEDSACRFCLACVEVCPSGALKDKTEFDLSEREKVLLPCTNNCPAKMEAHRYVKLIARGKYQEAIEVIRETAPFPGVLGYVCDHPCEEDCRRKGVNQPIAIRALKRFAFEEDSRRWRDKLRIAPGSGKKVAVVGAGPAGLTAAWFLTLAGHRVKVFESRDRAGGMMRSGIPRYRLPRKVLDKEIADIESIGVEIETGAEIESPGELFERGFDALFLATGAAGSMSMGIEGEEDRRVMQGVDVLEKIALKEEVSLEGDVAVVGGGNVAVDVARSAVRAGARKAVILYRRRRQEMPALKEEVEEALEEGVEFEFLTSPLKVISSPRGLKIRCTKMKLGEEDSSGRRRPIPLEGSEYIFPADRLIMAIGQKPTVPEGFDSLKNSWGGIEVEGDTMACSMEGVFAGGDAVNGPASVIKAIADGRKAARSIDRYLGGEGNIEQKLLPPEPPEECLGREEDFAYWKRVPVAAGDAEKRIADFRTVELGYGREEALREARRCLRCAMRLKISSPPLPPSDLTAERDIGEE